MPHFGRFEEDRRASPEQVGNVAQTLVIAHQTININGKPAWIQDVQVDDLCEARDRLYRVGQVHEAKSIVPIVAPIGVSAMVYALLYFVLAAADALPVTDSDKRLVLYFGAAFALPVWLAMYDMRRRHRGVVLAAERRWAEVVVEIAVRTPLHALPAPRPNPVQSFWRKLFDRDDR